MNKRIFELGGLFKFSASSPSAPQKIGVKHIVVLNFAFAISLLAANTVEPVKELRAPDQTQWTVNIVPKAPTRLAEAEKSKLNEAPNAKKPPAVTLVQSTGAKDQGIYRVQNRYNDQTEEDWWIISQYQHFKYKGKDQISRFLSSQNRAWNLEESDFPELYWAVGQTPEIQDIEGKKRLVIKMDASKKPLPKRQQRDLAEMRQAIGQSGETMPSPPPTSTGTLMLYLNPESGLPVRFEDIDFIYSYSYDKSPDLRAVIPEDIKNEIVAFEQKNSELTRPPSAPKIRNRKNQK
jgi:hypothetical protein